MKNIRNCVFETNSSSTHSIAINCAESQDLLESLNLDENNVLRLSGGEYGWQWERSNEAFEKANYAAVFAKDDPKLLEMLTKVLKEQTGATEVIYEMSEGYDEKNYSYIDHQSALGEGGECLKAFSSEENLRNFIFNPKSWLYLGNDNESAPFGFYH